MPPTGKLTAKERDALLATLERRFESNMPRHKGVKWAAVTKVLAADPKALWSLSEMERTGGEPDVVSLGKTPEILFVDCSPETPAGRRSLCFDRAALDARKKNKPKSCASDMAAAMGIELLTEDQYYALQELGEFDLKTSSWVATPPDVRERGGALFCHFRYGRVFTFHNGADSYYAARGFRGILKV